MSGSDLVATAQTGTGKTLAFLLPMLEKLMAAPKANAISTLILTPTRELAMQINDSFDTISAGTGFRAAVVVGGINEKTQLSAIRRGVHVVIATPGRLEDFTGRRLVNLSSIQTVVLDEADRMLDMGFAPAIERILAQLPLESAEHVLLGDNGEIGRAPDYPALEECSPNQYWRGCYHSAT